ncbi:hypothetical protein FHT02_001193 [Sphingomonas xinjiangensis]|uniref:Uncharacterized protein n=1 Tax=Sphingomonas xinjiangensis TaxID=643568 RepID=A0A840YCE4_9SPHN|nr:hypothetical protein [Sphingomonas xinjiangensis]
MQAPVSIFSNWANLPSFAEDGAMRRTRCKVMSMQTDTPDRILRIKTVL